jgi:hypothetical protein
MKFLLAESDPRLARRLGEEKRSRGCLKRPEPQPVARVESGKDFFYLNRL